MKKNALVLRFVLFGLLTLLVGCDSGPAANKASEKVSPPAEFMNKILLVENFTPNTAQAEIFTGSGMDYKTVSSIMQTYTLQTFIDEKVLESEGTTLTGWEKVPIGWKLNGNDAKQQKDVSFSFEADSHGSVYLVEVVFGGEVIPFAINSIYARGLQTHAKIKGY